MADENDVEVQVVGVALNLEMGGAADQVAETGKELNEYGDRVGLGVRFENADDLTEESGERLVVGPRQVADGGGSKAKPVSGRNVGSAG